MQRRTEYLHKSVTCTFGSRGRWASFFSGGESDLTGSTSACGRRRCEICEMDSIMSGAWPTPKQNLMNSDPNSRSRSRASSDSQLQSAATRMACNVEHPGAVRAWSDSGSVGRRSHDDLCLVHVGTCRHHCADLGPPARFPIGRGPRSYAPKHRFLNEQKFFSTPHRSDIVPLFMHSVELRESSCFHAAFNPSDRLQMAGWPDCSCGNTPSR